MKRLLKGIYLLKCSNYNSEKMEQEMPLLQKSNYVHRLLLAIKIEKNNSWNLKKLSWITRELI